VQNKARLNTAFLFTICVLTSSFSLRAQTNTWDTSGNGQLNGTFAFREVFYQLANGHGDLAAGQAVYGNISFDGKGHYSLTNANVVSRNSSGTTTTALAAAAGTYSIAVNGYGFLSGIYCPSTTCANNTLSVLVAQGMIVGSSPDAGLSDVFIASPVSTSASVSTAFQGNWTMAGMVPAVGATAGYSADVLFPLTPDGAGHLGDVSINGYFGVNGGAQTAQPLSNLTYTVNGGVVSIAVPQNYYFNGTVTLNFSPDGTFCFGGSNTGPDLIVGVLNSPSPSAQTFSGMYYGAGIDVNEYFLSQDFVDFDTYYGASAASGTNVIEAQRTIHAIYPPAFSNNLASTLPQTINGTWNNAGLMQYTVNPSATVRIGSGTWPTLGLSVALKAPTFSGTGVYLDPTGITNAASYAPFTAGISAGEYIVLYGSGLAADTTVAGSLPLPTTLDNVQILINNIPAPIYYVSPGQISVIVPSGVTGPVAQIQVVNNKVASNTVSVFVYKSSPGLFTSPSDGVSVGAIEHADGSLISEAHPVVPGETIQTYLTGLGPVSPAVPDGAAASADPLSRTTTPLTVYIGWAKGTVTYSGLVPTLAGLYQVNVVVPDDVPNGDQLFEIDTPDGNATQGLVPVSSSNTQQHPPAPHALVMAVQ